MISGAARAEAAVLVIDAKEGVRENSRRHGYILAMLGIRQVVVCVNKMDLVGYDQAHFEGIEKEYRAFLESIGAVSPRQFIPISAIEGENLALARQEVALVQGADAARGARRPAEGAAQGRPAAAHARAGRLQVHEAGRRSPHRRRAHRGGAREGGRQGRLLAVEQGQHDQEHRGLQHAGRARRSRPAGRRASRSPRRSTSRAARS